MPDQNDPTQEANEVDLAELMQLEGYEFLQCAYLTVLKREPDIQGLNHYSVKLAAGATKLQILNEIVGSDEALSKQSILAGLRDVIPDGIPDVSEDEDAPGLLGSWQHVSWLLSLDGIVFVRSAYSTILKRDADPKGEEFYVGRLKLGIAKNQILQELANSPEAKAAKDNNLGSTWGRNKKFNLIPCGNVVVTHEIGFDWDSKNDDPQFSIEDAIVLAGRKINIKFQLQTPKPLNSPTKLYLDIGAGFSEKESIELNVASGGLVYQDVLLPRSLLALRLDPASEATHLSIKDFQIRILGFSNPSSSKIGQKSQWKIGLHRPREGSDHRLMNDKERWQRLNEVEAFLADLNFKARSNVNWDARYIPKTKEIIDFSSLPIKLLAFYLPQFHPIPENDNWWGKGFTEWTNVTKAVPQYLGHHQPQLPTELGFYDLRSTDVIREQAALAKLYGIFGFCIYHYWFGGKQLLETPLKNLINDKTIDIGFCVCWANENWTRAWDGLENDILIGQNHSAEDDYAFLESLISAFEDPRYVRIDNKPVLLVYRASLLPDAKATASRWRMKMRDRGFEGIYLVAARAFDTGNPSDFGFDAAVEFPPHQTDSIAIDQTVTPINREFKGHVFDYAELSSRAGKVAYPEFTVFKTVMPSWDTEARKPGKGDSFAGAEPVTYANWLQDACTYTAGRRKEEQIIFVNAWNEWAEGAHVEPDRRFGYGFLHATANILRNYLVVETDEFIKQQNSQFRKTSVAVIVIHIFYEDLIDTLFSQYVQSVASICDVVVSVKADMPRASLKRIVDYCPNVYILSVPNIGRDIRPFILALRVVSDFGYVLGCKLHTKKSPHRADGDSWRDQMFDSLLGSKSVAQSTIYRFEQDPKLGVICPAASLTDLSEDRINAGNRMWLDKLLPKFGAQDLVGTYKTHFPAGSMYWFRTAAIDALLDHTFLDIDAFELEAGQLDGTLAHCIERLIPVVANRSGFTVEEI